MLTRDDLRTPLSDGSQLLVGFDTGAYMSCCFGLMLPESLDIFIIEEFPNYHYVGGEIERLDISDPEWARTILDAYKTFVPHKSKCRGWVDENSQFKQELLHYGLVLTGNHRGLELRVEITREYTQHNHLWLAPWLKILPYEFEQATWPDEHTSAGKFVREKHNDHTLDCVEHICSRRPRSRKFIRPKRESFLERHLREHRTISPHVGDPHLGRLG